MYKWRNPFIPALFYNNEELRHIISPTREFIDKICVVCATAEGVKYSDMPIADIIAEGSKKHGERTFEAAVKLKLFENGMAVYAKSVMNAKKWLDQLLNKRLVTLEQFMIHYGFSITKTRLRKQFSDLLETGAELKPVDTNKPSERKDRLFFDK